MLIPDFQPPESVWFRVTENLDSWTITELIVRPGERDCQTFAILEPNDRFSDLISLSHLSHCSNCRCAFSQVSDCHFVSGLSHIQRLLLWQIRSPENLPVFLFGITI
jgi:hypothetical protein